MLFLLLCNGQLCAQDFASTFKDKIGLVRIYLNNPKIKHLQSINADSTIGENLRKQAREQLDIHLMGRKAYTSELIKTFGEYYNVTKVLFIPDSLWKDFKLGINQAYFLNENGLLDPSISLPAGKEYYIIAQQDYDYDFRILDFEGQIPQEKFPYKIKHSLFSKIRGLMGSMAVESVKRLNKQLSIYK